MWNLSEIQLNPDNPRTLRTEKIEKLKNSIKDFERMLSIRPIVIDENNTVLGGNARLIALNELGYTQVQDAWIMRVDDLTEEQKKEFIIKDNVGFGDWDWDVLANEWNVEELTAWGLEVPGWGGEESEGEEDESGAGVAKDAKFSVLLHPEQESVIQAALDRIKKTDEYAYAETFGNTDVNGNALYVLAASSQELAHG